MKELTKAVIAVMQEVSYLAKDDTVGSGYSAYKAITDEKVRKVLRESMSKNGLVLFQESIEYSERVDRWEIVYNGQPKQKQQIKITAKVTYRLVHAESGESQFIDSIGIGVDPQDKSAGKATTYALKYALLNLFLIPTGNDPDRVHSDNIEVPQPKKKAKKKVKDYPALVEWIIQEDSKERQKKAIGLYEFTKEQLTEIKSLA